MEKNYLAIIIIIEGFHVVSWGISHDVESFVWMCQVVTGYKVLPLVMFFIYLTVQLTLIWGLSAGYFAFNYLKISLYE